MMKKTEIAGRRIVSILLSILIILYELAAPISWAEENDGSGGKEEKKIVETGDRSLKEKAGLSDNADHKDNDTEDQTDKKSGSDKDDLPEDLEEDKDKENKLSGFSEEVTIGGITVKVKAPEGSLPEGAILDVERIRKDDDIYDDISRAVEDERDKDSTSVRSYIFDVRILDEDGNEVQPDEDVEISFSGFSENLTDNKVIDGHIYHIKEKKEDLVAEKLEEKKKDDTYTATTDGFSYYTVDFEYNSIQYSIEGESTAKIEDILEHLGIPGEVTFAEGSNDDLFSFEERDGEWYIISHEPFQSTEWMKVVAGGIEYEIVVTDGTKVTVTFNKMGGTGGVDSRQMETGSASNNELSSSQRPTRSGYTFHGYYDAADGGTKVWDSSGNPNMDASTYWKRRLTFRNWNYGHDITLYAHWECTLTVEPMDGFLVGGNFGNAEGTSNVCSVTVIQGSSNYYTLGTASRPGYTFLGWYTARTGGDKVYDSTGTCVTGTGYWNADNKFCYNNNLVLYAHYQKNDITLTLDANGGSVSPTSKTAQYGTTVTDLPTPTRAGYRFSGWYANIGGSASNVLNFGNDYRYADKLSVHVSAYMDNWSSMNSSGHSDMTLISCTEGGGFAIDFEGGENKKLYYWVKTGDSATYGIDTGIYATSFNSGWNDFDLVCTGSQVLCYLNGTLVGSASYTGSITYNATAPLILGDEATPTGNGGSCVFGGYLGNVVIKNQDSVITSTNNSWTLPAQNATLYARWEANPITFNNQSISKTFSASAQTASITPATNGTGTYTYTKISEVLGSTASNNISISGSTINIAAGATAGTYTVVIRATDSNSGATKDATYTITIDKANISPAVSLDNWTYGSPKDPSVSGNSGGGSVTYEYKVQGAADSTYTTTKPSNVGSYTVRATIAATTNYNSGSATKNFTISKANGSVTAPTAKDLTYNGNPQTLINAGSSSTGTIQYKLGSSGTYGTSLPSATNAGTYTVYYKVVGDSNHNDVAENSITVTIDKAGITPTVSMTGWTYGGTANSPSVTGNTGSGTVTYEYKVQGAADSTYTTTKPTNAGDYTVRATVGATTNYNSGTATANFTIAKKEVTISWGTSSWTYDGNSHSTTCTAGGLVGSDTCTVTLSGNSVGPNVGSATVTASSLSNSNYKLPSANTKSISVTRASVGAKPTTSVSKTYNGSEQNNGYTTPGGVSMTGSNKGTNAGSYVAKYTPDSNHKWSDDTYGEVTVTLTIGTAAMTVTPTAYSGAYNGSAHSAQIKVNVAGATVEYGTSTSYGKSLTATSANTNYTMSEVAYTDFTNGAKTVYYRVSKANYATVTGTTTITISKANISPAVTLTGWTYGGTANSPSVTGNTGSGAVTYEYKVQGAADSTYTTTKPSNAGSYTVRATIAATTNYNGGSATTNFTIAKREVTLTWGTTSWVYDGNTHSTTCTAGNLVSGDTCTVTLTNNSVGKNVSSATVTASALSNSNYKLPSSNTKSISITKKEVTLTWGTTSWVYDGNTHLTTCTAGSLVSGDTCTVTLTGNSVGKNVGSATVTASALSNDNYKLPSSNTKSISITQREVTLTWGTTSWIYDGSAHSTTCTAENLVSGDTCTVTLTGNSVGPDVSSATVTASALSNSNYKLPSTKTKTIQITKKSGSVTISPTTLTLTYPTSKTASVTANTSGGALSVTTSNSAVATASISGTTVTVTPAAVTSDGQTATITVTSAATTNYNAASATINVTVNRGTITLTPASYSGSYDSSGHSAQIKSDVAGVTISYGESTSYGKSLTATNANTNYTMSEVTRTSPGTTTVYYKGSKAGYKDATGSTSIAINALTMTVTPTPYSAQYDGSAHNATVKVNIAGATIECGTSTSYGTTVTTNTTANQAYNLTPAYTDFTNGAKTIYYRVSKTGYTTVTGSTTVNITKKTISPIVSISDWAYGGTASNPSVSGNPGSGTVTYYYKLKSAADSTYTTTKPSDAGKYTIKAEVAATTNYAAGTATKDFNITFTATPTPYNSQYDGSAHYAQIKTSVGGAAVSYGTSTSYGKSLTATTANTNYSMTEVSLTNVGSQTVYYSASKNGYTVTGSTTITITANSGMTLTATPYSGTYDGSAHSAQIKSNLASTTISYGTSTSYGKTVTAGTSNVSMSEVTRTENGITTVYYKGSKANYSDKTGSTTITISPKFDNQSESVTYSPSSDQNVAITAAQGGTSFTYTKVSGSFTISGTNIVVPAGTAVGSYTTVVRATDTTSGHGSVTKDATYTITVNKASFTVTPVPYEGTYNGSAHYAKIKANIAGTTVSYGTSTSYGKSLAATDANTEYTMSDVSRTDVGTTTVYYKVSKANYNDVTGSTTIKINNATMTVTPTPYSAKYNGSAHSAQIKVNVAGATVEYGTSTSYGKTLTATSANTNYTMSEVAYTDFTNGAKTVYYRVSKANYTTVTGSTTITITKADNPLAFTSTQSVSKTYSTSDQTATLTAATGAQGTLSYAINSQKDSGGTAVTYFTLSGTTLTVKAGTPVGTYTVVVRATAAGNDNYNSGTKDSTVTVTVGKAANPLSYTATQSVTKTFSTASQTATLAAATGAQGTLSYAINSQKNSGGTAVTYFTLSGTTLTLAANTPAGTYTVVIRASAAGNDNYNSGTKDSTVTVTVGKAANPLSYTATQSVTKTFSTASQTATLAAATGAQGTLSYAINSQKNSGGTAVTYFTLSGTTLTVAASTPVGTYTVVIRASAAGNDNYNSGTKDSTVTVTVNKAAISPTASMSGWTYGGTASNPSVSGNPGSGAVTYTYKVSTAADSTYSATKPTNAGTYTVKAVVAETANYQGGTATANFTIAKAANPMTYASTQSVSKTFSTASQTATLSAASNNQGSVSYAINSQKNSGGTTVTYFTLSGTTLTVAANTPAGTYTVVVRATAAGNDNYNSGTKDSTVTVTVGKASISPTVSMSGWTYGGTASTPSVSGNTGGGSVTYEYKVSTAADSTYTTTKPSNAGTYTVRATIAATSNYNGGTATTNFTIAKAANPMTYASTQSVSKTFSTASQTATLTAAANNQGSVSYAINSQKTSGGTAVTYFTLSGTTLTLAANTPAGTYTVVVRATAAGNDNYNSGTKDSTVTVTVGKAANPLTYTSTQSVSKSFSTSSQTATLAAATNNQGALSYAINSQKTSGGTTVTYFTLSGTTLTIGANTPVGTYTVVIRATAAGNDNYNSGTKDSTVTVTIGKAAISPTVSMANWTYGGTASNPSVSGNPGSGTVTYHYKVQGAADSTYSTTKPRNAGSYTVRATVAETTSYQGGTATANFTIAKASNPMTYVSTQTVAKPFNTASQTATLSAASGAQGTLSYAINSQKTSGGTTVTYFTLSGTTLTLAAGTPVGTYTVVIRATAAGNDNYNSGTKDSTVTVTVNKAAISPTVSMSGWTYGGTASNPSVTGNPGSGAVTYEYKVQGAADSTYSTTKPSNAGSYTVRATVAETASYQSGTATTNFTIAKASNPMTYVSTQSVSKSFSTASQTATLTAAANNQGTVSYAINSQKTSGGTTVTYFTVSGTTLTLAASTPVGTYTVVIRATAAGNDNYNSGTKDSTVTVTVGKAAISPTVSMANWTYGGTASNPSVTGNPGSGAVTYEYKVQGAADSTYTTTKPSNAGSYTVRASIAETTSYQAGSATANFTISRANISPTVSMANWTYGGTASNPSVTGNPGSGTVTYEYKVQGAADSTYTTTKPSNAGSYTVRATIAQTSNYNGGTATANFMINNASMTVTPTAYSAVYDGSAHSAQIKVNIAGATVEYGTSTSYGYSLTATNANTNYAMSSVTRTNADGNPGVTTVYYKVTKANYTTVTGSTTISISKKSITPVISMADWAYGATASNPSVSGNTGSGTVTYSYKLKSASDSAYTTTKPSDAGKYTIKAVVAETTNYQSGTATKDFNITFTATPTPYSTTYDGSAHSAQIKTSVGGAVVSYGTSTSYGNSVTCTNANTSYSMSSVTRTNVGTTTVYYSATKNGYTVTGNTSISISNSTLVVTPTPYNAAYDGGAHSAQIKVNIAGATVEYGTSTSYGKTLTATNANTNYTMSEVAITNVSQSVQTVYYRVTKENYTTVTGSTTITITKKSISPTVSMSGWTYGGTASSPSTSGNPGVGAVTYEYKVSTAADSTYSTTKPTNAGTYTVRATVAETANYQGGTATANFTIAKAANPMTYTATQSVSKTFSTSSQTATLAAAANNQGSVSYAINSQKNSGGSAVTYFTLSGTTLTVGASTPAGTYTVVVRATAAGNDNYNSGTKDSTVTVTINKAAISPTVSMSGWTYGGTASNPSVSGNPGSGTVTYEYKVSTAADSTYSATKPSNAGTYTVRATVAETANYQGGTATTNFTIAKAANPISYVSTQSVSKTYSTSAQTAALTAATGAQGTLSYAINSQKTSGGTTVTYFTLSGTTLTVGASTPAGTYTVVVRATAAGNDNYNSGTKDSTVTVTIGKAANPMTYVSTQSVSKTFSTSSQTATLTAAQNNQGALSYAINSQKKGSTDVTYFTLSGTTLTLVPSTPAGTYTVVVRVTAAGNDNYNSGTADSTVTVTVSKAAISPTVSMANWTYGGTASNPSVSGNPGSGAVTYQYKVSTAADSTYTDTKPTNAGTYTVKATIAETSNYQGAAATANFTIAKAANPMTYASTQSVSKAFSTSSQTATLAAAANNQGSVSYAINSQKNSGGTAVTYFALSGTTLTVAANTPAGTYTVVVRATAAGNDNYNSGTKDSTVTVTVGKASISPTVSMANWTYGGTASTPSVSGNPGSGVVTYQYKVQGAADSTYTDTKPSNAGSYTVKATVAETSNYQGAAATANFTIAKAANPMTYASTQSVSKTFSTAAQTAALAAAANNQGALSYAINSQKTSGGTAVTYFTLSGTTLTIGANTPAGTYTVVIRATAAGNDNYNSGTKDSTVTVTIGKAANPMTYASTQSVSKTFSASSQTATLAAAQNNQGALSYAINSQKNSGGTDVTYFTLSGTTLTVAAGTPVGTYTVVIRATAAGNDNYNSGTKDSTVTVTIEKAAISPTVSMSGWTYGGTPSNPSVNGNPGSGSVTYEYKVSTAADSTYSATKPSNAGTYTVRATVAETANYQGGTATTNFTIAKAANPMTYASTQSVSKAYSTSAQTATLAAAANNQGSVSYAITSQKQGSTNVSHFTLSGTTLNIAADTPAGTYIVVIRATAAGNDNYNSGTKDSTVTVTIGKAPISPVVTMSGWTYGGTATNPSVSGNPGSGSVTYQYKVNTAADSTYTDTKPTNAGTYTVKATVAETSNYQGGTATTNFTIAKASNPMTYASTQTVSKTYSTSAQTAALAAAANNQGSVSYAITSQKQGSTNVSHFTISGTTLNIEASTPAGTYTVVVRATAAGNDNYNSGTKDSTVTVTIGKAAISPTVSMADWTYGGTASTPSVSGNPGSGAVTYQYKVKDAADSTYTSTKPSNAGTYTVKATVAETANYQSGTATTNFMISKAANPMTYASTQTVSKPYNTSAQTITLAAAANNQGSVSYELTSQKQGSTAVSYFTLSGTTLNVSASTPAGTYTVIVKATAAGNDNYNSGTKESTVTVTIGKAAITPSVSMANWTYGGTASTPSVSGNPDGGAVTYEYKVSTAADSAYTTTKPTNAGTYTVRATIAETANYQGGIATTNFTIAKAANPMSYASTQSVSKAFNTSAQTATLTAATGAQGTLSYAINSQKQGSTTVSYFTLSGTTLNIAANTPAGTYTVVVRATAAGNDNYNSGTKDSTVTVTIGKAAISPAVSMSGWTYGGTPSDPSVSGNPGSGAVTYEYKVSTAADSTYTTTKPTNAGTYTVKATVAETANYQSGTATTNFTIAKAANPMTFVETQIVSKLYSTSAQTATLTAAANNQGSVSYEITSQKQGTSVVSHFTLSGTTLNIAANTPAGTYTVIVRATAAGNSNYNSGTKESTVTVTIGKAAITPTVSMANWTYGETASTPSVNDNPGNGAVTYQYKVSTAADSTYTSTKPTNAGTYTVKATIAETANYQGAAATSNFTIAKAANPMTYASTQSVSKAFSTAAQTAALASASNNQGSVSYAINSQKKGSTDVTYFTLSGTTLNIAASTPAGTYTVVVRATADGNDNYNSVTKDSTVTVTIGKAAISPAVSMANWTYGDTASTPSVSGNPGSGAVTYQYKEQGAADSTYTDTKPTNAGTYTVKATVAETANYQGGTATTNFTIAKAANPVTYVSTQSVSKTYSTTAQTATLAAASNNQGALSYAIASQKKGSTEVSYFTVSGTTLNIAANTPAGTYTVVVRATAAGNDNYNSGTKDSTVTVTIGKAAITPSVSIASWTYGGTASTPSVSGNPGSGTITYEYKAKDAADSTYTTTKPTNAGTYTIKATIAETSNYQGGTATANFTISKAANPVTYVSTQTVSKTFSTDSQTATLASASNNQGSVSYAIESQKQGSTSVTYFTLSGTTLTVGPSTPAGTYTVVVRATAAGNDNYNSGTADSTVTVTVGKAANPMTYVSTQSVSKTFSTSSQTATLTAATEAQGTLSYAINSQKQGSSEVSYFTLSGTTLNIAANTPAGTYTVVVRATAAGNDNYNSGTKDSTVTVTIGKAAILPTVSMSGWTYGGTASTPSVSGNSGSGAVTYEYKVKDAADSTYTSTKPTNAGTYTVKATIAETTNYQGGTATTNFTISKAAISPGVTISDWVYGTTPSTPTVTGNSGNGTVTYNYKVQGAADSTYSDTKPTNVGSYTVRATIAETSNYNGGSATANFSITKANITPTVAISNWTYGGTPSNPSVTGNPGNGEVTYQYKVKDAADSTYTSTKPSNAGNYTIKATIAATANYNGGTATANFTINKASISPTVSIANWTYGETPSNPSVTGNTGGGAVTYEYKVQGAADSTYTGTKPTSAGNYTVRATIAETSNYNSGTATKNFTIGKASLSSFAVNISNWTYGETPSNPSVTGNTGNGIVIYEYKVQGAADSTYTSTKPTNAGSYTVRATAAETANYQSGTAIKNFTINKATMTITATPYTNPYDGNSHAIKIRSNIAGVTVNYGATPSYGKTLTITEANKDYLLTNTRSGDSVERTNVGITDVYYEVVMDNYEPVRGTKPVTITPEFENETKELTYDYGSSQNITITPAEGGTSYTYTEISETSGGVNTNYLSISGSNIIVAQNTPAGTYTYVVRATENETGLYTDATYTITVDKADMTVTATPFDGNYDGSAHSAKIRVNVDGAVINYGETTAYGKTLTASNADTDYALTEASRTATGVTTVYYKVSKANYNDVTGTTTVRITDTERPVPNVVSTNNTADRQTVTLNATDNLGITSYYWGTEQNPLVFIDVTSTPNFSTSLTVTQSGTYYLVVKDAAGNVGTASKTFYETTFSATHGTPSIAKVLTPQGSSFNTATITPDAGYKPQSVWTKTGGTINTNTSYTPSANDAMTAICAPYIMTLKYHVNSGTVSNGASYTDQGVTYIFRAGTDSIVEQSIDGGTTWTDRTEEITAETTSYDIWDVSTLGISREGYSTSPDTAYNTSADGTGINISQKYNSTINQPTIARLNNNQPLTADVTKVIYVNWQVNSYSIQYTGMDGATYGTDHPTTAVYGQNFTVDAPSKRFFRFLGWKITGMDSVTHTYGSSTTTNTVIDLTDATTFKNLRSTSGTVTFEAQWEQLTPAPTGVTNRPMIIIAILCLAAILIAILSGSKKKHC